VIEPNIATVEPAVDAGGRLVSSGFVETHIHPDKSCILDRCNSTRGDLEAAIGEAAKAKANFTPEDVHARATRTLEKAILQGTSGTTHKRTHLGVDPGVELRSLEGVRRSSDLRFPRGSPHNPGTDKLMVKARLRRGWRRTLHRFRSAWTGRSRLRDGEGVRRRRHLDFGPTADNMTFDHVCRRTDEYTSRSAM